ncbi:hypothetical protein HBN50_02920 [Halobacteriovorax sp. GB3]|uniref:hypothetical protein n=1 Tax=Halobacteriovorax sp. GB3 TaxID=2719615 RepID=UPI00236159A8|nr:hypothetical protein [Halobacteriovorax sp. GB3]MDD0852027.1 hypothetical protein [Halobacteriovorax sp. GB3]
MKASNDIVFSGYFFSVNSPEKIASSLYSKESSPNFNVCLEDDELFLFLEMGTEDEFGDSIVIHSRSDIDLKIKRIEVMANKFINKFEKEYFLIQTSKELCDFLIDLLKECFDIESRGAADYKYKT